MKFILKYFEELLASIAIIVVVLAAFYGVISRYILNNPVAWSNEIATISFTWTVFLGAAAAWKNNKHMLQPAIEILTKTKKYQDIAT